MTIREFNQYFQILRDRKEHLRINFIFLAHPFDLHRRRDEGNAGRQYFEIKFLNRGGQSLPANSYFSADLVGPASRDLRIVS